MPSFAPMMNPHGHGTEHFSGFPQIQMQQIPQIPPIPSISDPFYSLQVENSSHPQTNSIKIEQREINANFEHSLSVREEQISTKANKKNHNND